MLRTISSGNDRFSTRLNSETSEWENGDAIGIYMFDTEDKNVLNDALNVKYTTIGEGLTVNFSSDPGIAIYDMPTNFIKLIIRMPHLRMLLTLRQHFIK